jgi:predicted GIY-YIG superfamily endonuclease
MQVSKALVGLPGKPHALYRFFDRTDVLLYVGITMDLPARVGQHQKDKPWWVEVHHISVEQFESRSAALAAEERAIKEEGPLYNSTHNQLVSSSADLIRTAVGSKRDYADHLLHVQCSGPEEYEEWLDKARQEIAAAEPDDGLVGADEVVYATEVAAIELSGAAFAVRRALEHLLNQLPQDQVDRCRERAKDEEVSFDVTWTELELLERSARFVAAEFASQYLGELPEDERGEWIEAARVFMEKPKARWWQVATEAASYARHRKGGRRYGPAASMCSKRGRFSVACPSKAAARVWFDNCRICRRWDESQEVLAQLRTIIDGAESRDLTDEEAKRYEELEVQLGVLRTRDCEGHISWCLEHLRQAMKEPFTWKVDGSPMVVSKHEELEPDWDDPWRSGEPPF